MHGSLTPIWGRVMSLLETRVLCAHYDGLEVVHNVSVSVESGRIVTILGRNGAGKSTLLAACAGLHRMKSGDVLFEGENVTDLRADELVKRGLSISLGGRRIFHRQSVRDNLLLGGFPIRRQHSAVLGGLATCLDLFPVLKVKLNAVAGTLSGGEQQMLSIGQALMSNPRCLLLDEPSAGLAPILVGNVFDAVASLRDRGLAVLIVEQRVNETLAVADSGFVMDAGAIVLSGTSEELRSDADVRDIYIGRLGVAASEGVDNAKDGNTQKRNTTER
jgi:branched-chain amino acid transport system ATP-binding protein